MKISNESVALVTGGSSGIGKDTAERLLSLGATVVIADFDVKTGAATVAEFAAKYGARKIELVRCDVSSSEQLSATFAAVGNKYKRLDFVFNNGMSPLQTSLCLGSSLGCCCCRCSH